MSLSIILLPLMLPAIPVLVGLRLALGKEGFDNLMKSMEVRLPTTVSDRGELEAALRAAGYDFKRWLDQWKTHLKLRGEFFTWRFEEERWHAIFSKSVSPEVIARFVSDLEAKCGRAIFSGVGGADVAASTPVEPIPTNFADPDLLIKTLEDWGANVAHDADGVIRCAIGDTTLRFSRLPGEPYQVEVEKAAQRPEVLRQLLALDEDYKRGVQSQVYQNLKTRIQETELTIESEEVLEDNSIVLTLVVPETH